MVRVQRVEPQEGETQTGEKEKIQTQDTGILVNHLKILSAQPNKLQKHAQASLRLLERCRRRGDRASRRKPPCEASAVAEQMADLNEVEADFRRQCSAPTQREPEMKDVGRSMSELPMQPLKEALSEPALTRSSRRRAPHMHSVSSLPLLLDPAPMNKKWPLQVTMPLLGGDDAAALQDFVFSGADVVPSACGLQLQVGCFKIPHPRKAESGGEDSLFSGCDAVGVADGVGEWEWRFGLNPRAFADELMEGASAAAQITRSNASLAAQERASVMLEEGYKTTKSFGSATALVATLNVAGSELGVANLGDSGLRLIRRQSAPQPTDDSHPSEHQKQGAFTTGHHVFRRTREQQHAFNCPFQLARLPGPEDFDRLCEQGKTALVRAVQNTPSNRQDRPGHADLYTFPVQEGDLVVLGTDGVFDNLHDREICDLADMAASPFEAPYLVEPNSGKCRKPSDPARVAEAIAQAAFCRARDGSARTPFSIHAKEAGLYHVGGKMDDITVVAAWVVRGDGAAN